MPNCPRCKAENPKEARFCGTCGEDMPNEFDRPAGPVSLGSDSGSQQPPAAPPAPPMHQPPPPQQPSSPEPPAASRPPASTGESGQGSEFRGDQWGKTESYMPEDDYRAPQQHTDTASQQQGNPPPPASGQAYAPPPQQGSYQQPPPQQHYPQYGQSYDPNNTSGMGEGYPVPPDASGWTWAGMIPYGIFAFTINQVMWGVIGIFIPIIYMFYIGFAGKELAWKHKRWNSLAEYNQTMKTWNMVGLILFIVSVVFFGLYVLAVFGAMFMTMSEGNF